MPDSDAVPEVCLADHYNTALHDHYEFSCPVDSYKNPMQSYMNSLAYFCGREHIRIEGCKKGANSNFATLSSFWIALRRECGQWAWTDGYIGNATSLSCSAAKFALEQIQNANYTEAYGTIVPVSSALINSIQELLSDNPYIQ
jgi:hypothetical protein